LYRRPLLVARPVGPLPGRPLQPLTGSCSIVKASLVAGWADGSSKCSKATRSPLSARAMRACSARSSISVTMRVHPCCNSRSARPSATGNVMTAISPFVSVAPSPVLRAKWVGRVSDQQKNSNRAGDFGPPATAFGRSAEIRFAPFRSRSRVGLRRPRCQRRCQEPLCLYGLSALETLCTTERLSETL
jgi:hypothetical protein